MSNPRSLAGVRVGPQDGVTCATPVDLWLAGGGKYHRNRRRKIPTRERLNVAVSRGKGLSLVFASPRLLHTSCATVDQMRLVNALCALPDAGPLIQ